jgi:hypothetical protein
MDSTSPAHIDEDGYPAGYTFDVLSGGRQMQEHNAKEAYILPAEADRAVGLMRSLFDFTFGNRAAEKATGNKPPQTCIEVFDSATGTRTRDCD